MVIDLNVIATIASPVIALFVGVWVNRWFESRPILISYFGHISAFKTTPPDKEPIHVNTHTVVLRNVGRKAASNIRLHHNTLPDFNIWPSVTYSIEELPDGSKDIIIPTLVPSEEVTISYLYFPPLIASNINAGIKSDQGFARQIQVLLQRQYPLWFIKIVQTFLIIGVTASIYLVYILIGKIVG